tara:strand:+ start:10344 stop:10754 length:411 start_codon:yes stop_codon:yes gene_type:complete
MPLLLRVISPSQNIFEGDADEVILPSTTGQIGILPGHISLVTAIDIGVLKVKTSDDWATIALMGGFAEVESDEVTVLVNSAELGTNINLKEAEEELIKATAEGDKYQNEEKSPDKIKTINQINRARARVQASKANQ